MQYKYSCNYTHKKNMQYNEVLYFNKPTQHINILLILTRKYLSSIKFQPIGGCGDAAIGTCGFVHGGHVTHNISIHVYPAANPLSDTPAEPITTHSDGGSKMII